MSQEAVKDKLQEALKEYKANPTGAKDYFTSMKEMSSWLQSEKKS